MSLHKHRRYLAIGALCLVGLACSLAGRAAEPQERVVTATAQPVVVVTATAQPVLVVTATAQPVQVVTATAQPQQIVIVTATPLPVVIDWEPSQNTLILRGEDLRAFPGAQLSARFEHALENSIPTAQIWGDGRIVWVEYNSATGARQVREGRFSRAELVDIFQRIRAAGFFTQVSPPPATQSPIRTSLYVRLKTIEKTVVYDGPPPAAIDKILLWLERGASATGAAYAPGRARLCAYLQKGAVQPPSFHWPAGLAGFDLKSGECRMIQGPILDFSWSVINQAPAIAQVEAQGRTFLLTLQIPDLTGQ